MVSIHTFGLGATAGFGRGGGGGGGGGVGGGGVCGVSKVASVLSSSTVGPLLKSCID